MTDDSRAGDGSRTGDARTSDSPAGDARAGDARAGDARAGDARAGDGRTGDSPAGGGSSVARRRVLQAMGAGGLAGLAGCFHDDPGTPTGTETDTTPTPTDTPEPCPPVEFVLNTGFDQDAGSTISPCNPDDDWDVVAEDVSAGPVPRDADVVDPPGAWAAPFADSQWISVTCDANPGVTFDEELFEYEYCFCLNEGFRNPELEAELRADDAIEDVRLNGTSLAVTGNGTFSGRPAQVSTDSRRLFRAGENCLTVVVRDTGAIVTGLNVAGTVTAENADCECDRGECDLAVEKTSPEPFQFGATGTYVVEVCNEGDAACREPVEVTDEVPPGATFVGASGSGWSVTNNAGTLTLTHSNSGALPPGQCLPPVEIDVQVAPFEEFPDEGALENCAELVTGGANTDNDVDCDTPCVRGERTFEGGVRDRYDGSNSEPSSPSAGLQAAFGNLKGFDDTATNTHFGHTFDGLRPSSAVGEICEAELQVCLRPEEIPLNTNDTIRLGVWDASGNPVGPTWGRKLGNDGGQPGLFDTQWRPSATRGECITLDLSALPEAGGGTTNLLGLLNTHNRISLHVQDDTTVDFAHLSVRYCCDDGGDGECQPAVTKRPRGEFQFGEPGSYVVEVCNEGEGTCEGPFEVTDRLPQGVSFVGASGSGWQCQLQGGDVVCEHQNPGGLSPGECLPSLVINVEVGSAEEVGADRIRNCVELRHAGQFVEETCVTHGISGGGGGGGEGCQLSVEKVVENPFEFGGAGAYGFEVCNTGDEPCRAEVVEIVDDLPDGFRFLGGGGTGWTCEVVDSANQIVSCTYEGVSLEPGECLPRNVWEIEVVPEEEWPHDTNTVTNCARLSTATEQVDEDCIEHRVE